MTVIKKLPVREDRQFGQGEILKEGDESGDI